jgi:hypothetical protein
LVLRHEDRRSAHIIAAVFVLNPKTFPIMNKMDENLGRGCYYCLCWTYGYSLHIVGYTLCYMWCVLIFMWYFRPQIISNIHYCRNGFFMTGCSRIRDCHVLKSNVKTSVDLECWLRCMSEKKSKLLNLCNWRLHLCIDFLQRSLTTSYYWSVKPTMKHFTLKEMCCYNIQEIKTA